MRGESKAAADRSSIEAKADCVTERDKQAGAASEPGFALKVAEARKLASHNAECRNIGVLFFPIVVETLGGWSPD